MAFGVFAGSVNVRAAIADAEMAAGNGIERNMCDERMSAASTSQVTPLSRARRKWAADSESFPGPELVGLTSAACNRQSTHGDANREETEG